MIDLPSQNRKHGIITDISDKSSISSNFSSKFSETSDDSDISRRLSDRRKDSDDLSTIVTLDGLQRGSAGHDKDVS